jgi:5-carboxymethyl-2-hydroxymuconate isomerase
MSRIDSLHQTISTGLHFQNGHHNTAAMLKMETVRNFSMSGINSGHHNLPTYEMALKLDNVEFVRIVVAILKRVNR